MECISVVVKIVSFNMYGMRSGQNCKFQHGWNVSWSKLSISACLECVGGKECLKGFNQLF
jgi:hypothetical protein